MLYFIDTSHWDDKVDYPTVMKSGYGTKKLIPVANYIKATDGSTYVDNLYVHHLTESRKVNLATGAFHYYIDTDDPIVQATHFSQVYLANGGTDLPPCLDVETIDNPKLTASKVLICLQTIEKLTGRKPIIYTGFYVWRDMVGSPTWSTNYLLWLASYNPINLVQVPKPWVKWSMWQFSDSQGDEDYYDGTIEDLKQLCGSYWTTQPSEKINWYDGLSLEDKVNILCKNHPDIKV
jgi:GH25 family lysozyme M1 (1,4-beta-N-acetylmuramidase)